MSLFTIPCDEYAEEKAENDQEWRTFLYDTLSDVQRGRFGKEFTDAIVQPWGKYSLGDVWLFAQIYALTQMGWVLFTQADLGEEPLPDKEREGNQAILNRSLSNVRMRGEDHGLHAVVDMNQKTSESGDGRFYWDKLMAANKGDFGEWSASLDAGSMPLEIGTTRAATTFEHILYRGGVARWPYHGRNLWIFIPHPDHKKDIQDLSVVKEAGQKMLQAAGEEDAD